MSDDRHALEISADLARSEGVPEDLDATQREPYTIPTTRRRTSAAFVYAGGAAMAALGIAAGMPAGLWIIVAVFGVMAAWHAVSAWSIEILDPQALEIANRATEFTVGHASAAVGFDGLRAKPVWNVLVFSADDPPSQRGLVRVDAVSGDVVEVYTEAVPANE